MDLGIRRVPDGGERHRVELYPGAFHTLLVTAGVAFRTAVLSVCAARSLGLKKQTTGLLRRTLTMSSIMFVNHVLFAKTSNTM